MSFACVEIKNINKTLVDKVLSDSENALFVALYPDKKTDWLAGRMAVKKTVKNYLSDFSNDRVFLKDIEILRFKNKKPFLKINPAMAGGERLSGLDISLSHSGGIGAGAISEKKGSLVGIDIEKIRAGGAKR